MYSLDLLGTYTICNDIIEPPVNGCFLDSSLLGAQIKFTQL